VRAGCAIISARHSRKFGRRVTDRARIFGGQTPLAHPPCFRHFPRAMSQKNFGCLGVGLLVVLCLSLLVNFAFVVEKASHGTSGLIHAKAPKFEEEVLVEARPAKDMTQSDAKIVVVYLRGIITAAEPGALGETVIDDIKLQLRQAGEDEKVKAVVLYIDSPGGEVTASDSIYTAVKKFRETTKKPVVVYMGSLAASGGYYVACAGNWSIANETTLTGSIGVIMQTLSYQQLLGKVGLEMRTFKSGKFKDMLSGSREITPEEQEYVQNLIMQTYGKFVGIVARERKLNEDELRNGLADGRVISGKDAFAAKLINGLGEVEDAYNKAMELGKAKGATIVRYESPFKLSKLFRMLGQSEKTNVEVNLTRSLLPHLEAGRLYFLPSYYAP
jgi:protease-4